jgi:transposase InsO family protein
MYRVLAAHDQVRERRHPEYRKPQLVATTPNQVWSWDTTKLPGPTKGTYFTLYVIVDQHLQPLHRRLAGDHA